MTPVMDHCALERGNLAHGQLLLLGLEHRRQVAIALRILDGRLLGGEFHIHVRQRVARTSPTLPTARALKTYCVMHPVHRR